MCANVAWRLQHYVDAFIHASIGHVTFLSMDTPMHVLVTFSVPASCLIPFGSVTNAANVTHLFSYAMAFCVADSSWSSSCAKSPVSTKLSLFLMSAGVRRFYDNIELMLGYRINRWLMVCWTVITPLLTFVSVNYFLFPDSKTTDR